MVVVAAMVTLKSVDSIFARDRSESMTSV